jgi:hypothetical protein
MDAMNYYIRKIGAEDFSGPFTLAEIKQEILAQRATRLWEAVEASGQTYHELVKARGWVSIDLLLGEFCPSNTEPVSESPKLPAKKSVLFRCAIWSGGITVGVPVLWAALTSTLGGNASLALGWYGVLPLLLRVPLGVILTLGFAIAAVVRSNAQKDAAQPDESGKPD